MGKRTPEEKDVFITNVVKWTKRAGAVLGALGALLGPMVVMWLQVADANKQSGDAKKKTVEVKAQQDIGYEKMVMPALEALQKGSEEEQEWADDINAYLEEHEEDTHDLEHRIVRLEAMVEVFSMRLGNPRIREPASVAELEHDEPLPFQKARKTANRPKVKIYKDLQTAQQQLAD
jgi:hypothetical protein